LWVLVVLILILMSTTLIEYNQILGSEHRSPQTSTVSVVSNRTITVTPPTSTVSVVSNRTVTVTSTSSINGSSVVTAVVFIQDHVWDETCILITATSSSTLYLTPTILSNAFLPSTTTTTISQTTTTTWENFTETVGNTICVYVSSHYNVTQPQSCPAPPPCV
jgi:hypothetical protein